VAKHKAAYDAKNAEREKQKKKGVIRFKELEWVNDADLVMQRAYQNGTLITDHRYYHLRP
jgi:hypothetical protein